MQVSSGGQGIRTPEELALLAGPQERASSDGGARRGGSRYADGRGRTCCAAVVCRQRGPSTGEASSLRSCLWSGDVTSGHPVRVTKRKFDLAMVTAVGAAVLISGGTALGLVLFGGEPKPTPAAGAAATWEVVAPYPVAASRNTTLTIAVTRERCADGRTGSALTPRVTYESERIVILAQVEPLVGDGARNCQGNDAVLVVVKLDEPIGDRDLVDGTCLNDGLDRPAAVQGGSCADPVRWSFRCPGCSS